MSRRYLTVTGALVVTGVVAVLPLPALSATGQYALATMAFAAVLWVTGAIPLPVTALSIPLLLTAFGVFPTMTGALAAFADPVIFLLIGGFVLAEALQKYDIDRRIAYRLVESLGTSPRRLVLAVMVATASLSMLISNSATTAMMVPVALGIARQVHTDTVGDGVSAAEGMGSPPSNLEVSMLLGTAYAASIGGVGTLIGTPPNAIVVAQLASQLGYRLGFAQWLVIGLPLVIVGLPLAWYLLTYQLYPPEVESTTVARQHATTALTEMGTLTSGGRRVIVITAATAVLWLLGGLGFLFEGLIATRWHATLFGGPVSVFGVPHQGVLYFVFVGLLAVPALVVAGAVDWDDIADIDWGTLVLLGGGIALANALATTDATRWLADVTLGTLVGAPILLVALAVVMITVLFSELASNTAIAAIFAPLLISLGPRYAASLGTSSETASVFLAVTGAVAASFGFALPVATPPNAIAFGTGHLTKDHMLRAGIRLDIVMIFVATVLLLGLFRFVWPHVF